MNTDQLELHNVVCFGEILWDLLPDGAQPGGAPMNVAYHLKQLGQQPAMISRIGKDSRGTEMLQVLVEKNVVTEYVQQDDIYPTGIVYATPNEHHEMQYEIVQPVAWDFIVEENSSKQLVQQADYFIFGSLASRTEVSRNTLITLLETAKTKVLDINLRPPHYNQKLVEELLSKADILKMNESELSLISDWYGKFENTEDRISAIQEKFKLSTIIVTMGAEGAVINVNGTTYKNKGVKVKVADTVGSGDSFLAAFLSKTINHASPAEALQFACTVGALVASKTGGCPAYTLSDVEQLTETVLK